MPIQDIPFEQWIPLLVSFGGGAIFAFIGITLRQLYKQKELIGLQAELKARKENYESTARKAKECEETLKQMQTEKGNLIGELKASQARAEAQKESFETAKKEFTGQFENLANRIFEDKSQKFTKQNKENLDQLLTPLKENIRDFRTKIETTYNTDSKDRTALHEQIKQLTALNEQVSQDAVDLANALKGDSQVMGSWGEHTLERILELSGLEKGREYETQVSAQQVDGASFRPDVVVRLPEKRDIIIDSKVSLKDYEVFCNTKDNAERAAALHKHLSSVKNHLKSLADKDYERLEGIHSLDYILMFIPIEAAYITAVKEEPKIFNDAIQKKILIVCPSTLLITLRTIANIWRYEKQNQNAKTIAKKAAGLYEKFVGFVVSLQTVQKKIGDAGDECDKAMRQLSTGRGSLVSRTEEFKEMGIEPKKQLPDNLLEKTE